MNAKFASEAVLAKFAVSSLPVVDIVLHKNPVGRNADPTNISAPTTQLENVAPKLVE